ncbi:hypothetical protein D3C71_1802240 [compost metagenome]
MRLLDPEPDGHDIEDGVLVDPLCFELAAEFGGFEEGALRFLGARNLDHGSFTLHKLLEFCLDPPFRVCGEPETLLKVELLGGPHESLVSDRSQRFEGVSVVAVSGGDLDDLAEMGFH